MMKHWSNQVSEVTFSYSPNFNNKNELPVSIVGGSEKGQFCEISEFIEEQKLRYYGNAKLRAHDLVLEVQGQKVAGYTSHDLRDWIISVGQNSTPVLLKAAKAGTLMRDLRPYLNSGFPKGSIDHDTQMTIRENLFQRTVPCTTRTPRDGEVNGVDYTFVSLERFRELDRNGNLLESGEFDGNHYGMPKPPAEDAPVSPSRGDSRPGPHPSSKGKRERNRSTIEATSNKSERHPSPTPSPPPSPTPANPEPLSDPRPDTPTSLDMADELGPLPPNWEMAFTDEGHVYFIDHNTETTHWVDPRIGEDLGEDHESAPPSPMQPESDLPYGWEKVEDPQYGAYYIDHINKRTQYDPPEPSSLPHRAAPHELHSPANSARSNRSLPSYREIDSAFNSRNIEDIAGDYVEVEYRNPLITALVSQQHTKPFFTKNPAELSGEIIQTGLVKSPRGFGFTIVGGEDRDEEFLQIKNVVPNGPADRDGMLRTGDVLVRINGSLVLGYTHSDVVSVFQTIKPGARVLLEICRGYPLAFDPNDPNTEIVTTVAVSMPKRTDAELKQREAERARGGLQPDEADNSSLDDFADSLLHDLTESKDSNLVESRSSRSPVSPKSPTVLPPTGQMFSIEIERGDNGFGFTIADSVHGQKVKHIIDKGRCKTLQEDDILVKIAGHPVREIDHSRVVDVLKSCRLGVPTEIIVQRGGLKKLPKRPSKSHLSDDVSNDEDDVDALNHESPQANSPPLPQGHVKPPEGMFKWTNKAYSSSRQLAALRGRDDGSEEATPPPLPSKGRLHSDTTLDSKENLAAPQVVESHQPVVPPGILKDSSNFNNKHADQTAVSKPPPASQHPVLNQYQSQPKESFYDIPNKFRSETGLTARQRFDMLAPKHDPKLHQFGQPLDPMNRNQPQVLPPLPNGQGGGMGRSRTPGPEHIRPPPERAPERFRSKTPNEHRRSFHQNNLNSPGGGGPAGGPAGAVGLFGDRPMEPRLVWHNEEIGLLRGEQGFGFRIVGGPEERTQVAIGYIVPGGAADSNGRLCKGDEIIRVNDINTVGQSHHTVVQLMGQAASQGHVRIGIRRKVIAPQDLSDSKPVPDLTGPGPLPTSSVSQPLHQTRLPSDPPGREPQPFEVVVSRNEDEGFGFIIVSTVNRMGAVIGRIIESSPADRCGRLKVGDRILAVNNMDISKRLHEDIVTLIKDSGYTVKLLVAQATNSADPRPNQSSMMSTTALPAGLSESETLLRNMHSHTTSDTAARYNGPANGLHGVPPTGGPQPGSLGVGPHGVPPTGGLQSGQRGAPLNRPPSRPTQQQSPGRASDFSSTRVPFSQANDPPRPYEPSRNVMASSYPPPSDPGRPSDPSRPSDPERAMSRGPTSYLDLGRSQSRGPLSSTSTSISNQPPVGSGSIKSITLHRSSRGFGFSIRGGREFNNMPLYVLRIAEEGAAFIDRRLQVGDEILEINSNSTHGMSHADAIHHIGKGSEVQLLIRRGTGAPISDAGAPSPQGSGMSSPAIRNPAASGPAYPSTAGPTHSVSARNAPPQHALQQHALPQHALSHNVPAHNASLHNAPSQQAMPQQSLSHNALPHSAPSHNIPPHNTPPHTAPSHNPPPHNAPSYNAPSRNAPPYSQPPDARFSMADRSGANGLYLSRAPAHQSEPQRHPGYVAEARPSYPAEPRYSRSERQPPALADDRYAPGGRLEPSYASPPSYPANERQLQASHMRPGSEPPRNQGYPRPSYGQLPNRHPGQRQPFDSRNPVDSRNPGDSLSSSNYPNSTQSHTTSQPGSQPPASYPPNSRSSWSQTSDKPFSYTAPGGPTNSRPYSHSNTAPFSGGVPSNTGTYSQGSQPATGPYSRGNLPASGLQQEGGPVYGAGGAGVYKPMDYGANGMVERGVGYNRGYNSSVSSNVYSRPNY